MKYSRYVLTTFSFLAFATAPAGAVVLLEYKFDSDATVFDPNVVASDISASDFTRGSSIGNTNTTSSVSQSGRSLFSDNGSFYQGTQSGALGLGDYLYFTLTVDSGFEADLTSLDFYTLRRATEGAGAPSGYAIYSSDDSYATALDSGAINTVGDTSSTFTAQSADISALQDLTGTTQFRMVFWAGDGIATPSQRRWRLDEVSLNGTVVPEPSSAALLSLALGLAFLRRRRS